MPPIYVGLRVFSEVKLVGLVGELDCLIYLTSVVLLI